MSGNRPRPESSIAQSFAADLDSMFGLSTGEVPARSNLDTSSSHDEIAQALNEKKQTLSSKAAELEELEARLKATEERLAKSRNASPARINHQQANVGAPITTALQQPTVPVQKAGHPLAQQPSYPPDRPPTQRENTQAMMSGMPGHLPATPQEYGHGRDEYVVVDSNASAGYGQAVR